MNFNYAYLTNFRSGLALSYYNKFGLYFTYLGRQVLYGTDGKFTQIALYTIICCKYYIYLKILYWYEGNKCKCYEICLPIR